MSLNYAWIDQTAKRRFELDMPAETPYVEYILVKDKIYLTHTEVPEVQEGKGLGSYIVKRTLDHIREQNLTLIPLCPFVAMYIKRHPEYRDLVLKNIHIG